MRGKCQNKQGCNEPWWPYGGTSHCSSNVGARHYKCTINTIHSGLCHFQSWHTVTQTITLQFIPKCQSTLLITARCKTLFRCIPQLWMLINVTLQLYFCDVFGAGGWVLSCIDIDVIQLRLKCAFKYFLQQFNLCSKWILTKSILNCRTLLLHQYTVH